jgi:hypothetical protein
MAPFGYGYVFPLRGWNVRLLMAIMFYGKTGAFARPLTLFLVQ